MKRLAIHGQGVDHSVGGFASLSMGGKDYTAQFVQEAIEQASSPRKDYSRIMALRAAVAACGQVAAWEFHLGRKEEVCDPFKHIIRLAVDAIYHDNKERR